MTPGTQEEVPYTHVITALNSQLLIRNSELAMAEARILSRDQQIQELREQVRELNVRLGQVMEELQGSPE